MDRYERSTPRCDGRALGSVAVGGAAEGIRPESNNGPLGFFSRRCAWLGHHPRAAILPWPHLLGAGQHCCRDSSRRLPHDCHRGGVTVQGEEFFRQRTRDLVGATEGTTDHMGQADDEGVRAIHLLELRLQRLARRPGE
jgi:hypothetical protein